MTLQQLWQLTTIIEKDTDKKLKMDKLEKIIHLFSPTPKDNFEKFDNYELYYSPDSNIHPNYHYSEQYFSEENRRWMYRESDSAFEGKYNNQSFILLFDTYHKTKFLIGFFNCSPYGNYRNYILVSIINSSFVFTSIPDPEQSYRIGKEIYHGWTWNFDNRNRDREILHNDKIYVVINHRDTFHGNTSVMVHDINTNTRTQYLNRGSYAYITPQEIKIENDKLQIGNYVLQ
jgi:hypothetical protein